MLSKHASDPINAAILFEPDGYVLSKRGVMGRHSAGRAYLKAFLAGLDPSLPIFAYTPKESSARVLASILAKTEPRRKLKWVKGSEIQKLQIPGTMYVPGPSLGNYARMRQRIGGNAYSLVGVTHTTATERVMDALAELLVAPVMPWDAVICTSHSVQKMVMEVVDAEVDYLKLRLGASNFILPKLPIIPLGIHTSEFVFTRNEQRSSRKKLGIDQNELVVLSVGRFNYTSKMHPFQMYEALNNVSRELPEQICLIQCGWFINDTNKTIIKTAAARYAPNVRLIWLDGRSDRDLRLAWGCGDVFLSLVDNIQETFGLTPLEAMAAGIPVVASDWNGYRETVRHGVDGFLVPTSLPAPGFGEELARRHQSGDRSYDRYCGAAGLTASVDIEQLIIALRVLCTNGALRRKMGESGRLRAQSFDWTIIFSQYLDLFRELRTVRNQNHNNLNISPRAPANRQDPFRLFASYPTFAINDTTLIQRVDGWSSSVLGDPLFSFAAADFVDGEVTERLLAALPTSEPVSIRDCAKSAAVSVNSAVLAFCRLAKAGGVSFIHESAGKIYGEDSTITG